MTRNMEWSDKVTFPSLRVASRVAFVKRQVVNYPVSPTFGRPGEIFLRQECFSPPGHPPVVKICLGGDSVVFSFFFFTVLHEKMESSPGFRERSFSFCSTRTLKPGGFRSFLCLRDASTQLSAIAHHEYHSQSEFCMT